MASELHRTGLFDAPTAVEEIALSQQGISVPGPGEAFALFAFLRHRAVDPPFLWSLAVAVDQDDRQEDQSGHPVLHRRRCG